MLSKDDFRLWDTKLYDFKRGKIDQSWLEEQKKSFNSDFLSIERLNKLRTLDIWNEYETVEFKKLIKNVIGTGGGGKYLANLLDDAGMTYFTTAFTHSSSDPNNNYEHLEFLGDLTYNKCVGWYLPRRYPRLFSPDAEDILTKLKINFIQSKAMGLMAQKSGFLKFIHYDPTSFVFTSTNIQDVLEDVFEAFFGATEWLIDSRTTIGVGYGVCYKIVSKKLDAENFSFEFVDLMDPITILKEIFDKFKGSLGTHKSIQIEESLPTFRVKYIQTLPSGIVRTIGEGLDYKEQQGDPTTAKQKAAKNALKFLESEGIRHPNEGKYRKFCNIKN